MKKCDCYHIEEEIIGWHTSVDPKIKMTSRCWGTKEREECSCGGDRTKCNFYPEVREKALKEQQPKFGEWISVEERLPSSENLERSQFHNFLVANEFGEVREAVFTGKYFAKLGSRLSSVTHWMPLPEPPTEKGELI